MTLLRLDQSAIVSTTMDKNHQWPPPQPAVFLHNCQEYACGNTNYDLIYSFYSYRPRVQRTPQLWLSSSTVTSSMTASRACQSTTPWRSNGYEDLIIRIKIKRCRNYTRKRLKLVSNKPLVATLAKKTKVQGR